MHTQSTRTNKRPRTIRGNPINFTSPQPPSSATNAASNATKHSKHAINAVTRELIPVATNQPRLTGSNGVNRPSVQQKAVHLFVTTRRRISGTNQATVNPSRNKLGVSLPHCHGRTLTQRATDKQGNTPTRSILTPTTNHGSTMLKVSPKATLQHALTHRRFSTG